MSLQQAEGWTRRRFLGGLTVAGTAGLLGLYPRLVAAEPPPEVTTLRLGQTPAICIAPLYVAEEILPSEGFTEVQYVKMTAQLLTKAVTAGEVDIALNFSGPHLIRVEAGDPLVILAGVHVGCFELVCTDRVHAIRDLKGKIVAVSELGSAEHVFLASMVAYVGLDPNGMKFRWKFRVPKDLA